MRRLSLRSYVQRGDIRGLNDYQIHQHIRKECGAGFLDGVEGRRRMGIGQGRWKWKGGRATGEGTEEMEGAHIGEGGGGVVVGVPGGVTRVVVTQVSTVYTTVAPGINAVFKSVKDFLHAIH